MLRVKKCSLLWKLTFAMCVFSVFSVHELPCSAGINTSLRWQRSIPDIEINLIFRFLQDAIHLDDMRAEREVNSKLKTKPLQCIIFILKILSDGNAFLKVSKVSKASADCTGHV